MEPIAKHTTQAVDARKVDVQGLANIAYGAASSGMGQLLHALFRVLAKTAEQRVGEFKAQCLANTT